MIDFFGRAAKSELAAFRASAKLMDESRQAEIQRLGSLLNATIMKLLAVTDRDAHRAIAFSETEQKPQPSGSASFLRRDSAAAAVRKSKEAASGGA